MNNIHPTAIVSSKAELGDNITIGPNVYIEDDVVIGENCSIGPNVCIYNGARIGNNVKIFQGASVSNLPQDLKFGDEQTFFHIGDNCVIREFVTLHKGTTESYESRIGSNCLLMAYAHIAHDCILGDNVILSNGVQIGGHAHVGNWVIIGGTTPVHQFSKIGDHAMIGGGLRVIADVPPYVLAGGSPLRFAGLNVVGLKRRGFSKEAIDTLKGVYAILYSKKHNFGQARKIIAEEFAGNEWAQSVLDFLESTTRGIIRR